MSSKRFVVGIDGTDYARRAMRWAVDETVTWDAELDVVHAWDPPLTIVPPPIGVGYAADVDAIEHAAAALLDAEVAAAVDGRYQHIPYVEKMVLRDSAAGALVDTAKGADLLVVGSHGHGTFRGALLGSVSNHCAHHAPCPVAIIRGDVEVELDPSRRDHIVVGIDRSECSYDALTWALHESAQRRARLSTVMAWSWLDQPGKFDPDYGAGDVKAAAEAFVAKARDDVDGGRDIDVEIRPVNDHASPALIDASAQAGLLVVGSRGLGGFRGLLLGSVSSQCIHHAHCPVVVVRRG